MTLISYARETVADIIDRILKAEEAPMPPMPPMVCKACGTLIFARGAWVYGLPPEHQPRTYWCDCPGGIPTE